MLVRVQFRASFIPSTLDLRVYAINCVNSCNTQFLRTPPDKTSIILSFHSTFSIPLFFCDHCDICNVNCLFSFSQKGNFLFQVRKKCVISNFYTKIIIKRYTRTCLHRGYDIPCCYLCSIILKFSTNSRLLWAQ